MKSILAGLVLTAVVCAAAMFGAAEEPRGKLPAGWHLEGDQLVWTSDVPLPMGGARYEFRSGKRLLGFPIQRGDSLRLRRSFAEPLTDLSVRAAGRRVDVPVSRALRPLLPPPPPEPATAESAFDPSLRGPYETQRLRYRLPRLAIPEFPAAVEVLAEVTAPVDDIGPLPLVLFLHGRHSTCYRGGPAGEVSGDWPCPDGWNAVPSHTGYRYLTDVLASQGYLTVSIAANGINGQDGLFMDGGSFARSLLVRHHLARWAQWSSGGGDPWGGRFRGRVDMDEVVLVGHSRGGEGVERAAIDTDARDRWKIRGLVLIGPTAFGRQVAAGIHTTVLLPFCDGDVFDLQGQQYVDIGRDLARDPALRSSVMAMGTNHNFYNTEWTPGLSRSPAWDDWFDSGDAQCGETSERRLAPAEQQAVGLAYTAALVDLATANGTRSLPLLDGTPVKPRSIGRANAFVHAIGGAKSLLYAPGTGTKVTARSLRASECRGYYVAGPFDLRLGCTPRLFFELVPHWSPMAFAETAPAPRALKVEWTEAGGSLRIPVAPLGPHAEALDFRMAGAPGAQPIEFDVRVRDSGGGWIRLNERPLELRSYFGPSPLGKVVARQLRTSLRGARVNPGRIAEIELVPHAGRGRFWLLDISSWQDSVAASDHIHLPRVSAGDLVVKEGDEGRVRLDVPITIEGAVRKRASLWVQLTDYADLDDPTSGFPLVLEPGSKTSSVPLDFDADDLYNPYERLIRVTLLARRNAVTGDFDGSVQIVEDDPPPTLAVDARHVTAAEGSSLTWTFRLSKPMSSDALWTVSPIPAAGRFAELDTNDVPTAFLEGLGIIPPDPAVPLSEVGIFFTIEFTAGQQTDSFSIPVAADGVEEEGEGVALLLEGFDDPVVPRPIELTGVVPASGPAQ